MDFYTSRLDRFTIELALLKKQYNTIGFLRLACVAGILFFGYYSLLPGNNTVWVLLIVFCMVAFIYLMHRHNSISKKKLRAQALIQINQNEIAYLNREAIPFEDGNEFTDTHHAYSHDLDIFGKQSLFHNINRTKTYIGKSKLAGMLLSILPEEEILKNQNAIKELAQKAEWRQEIMALGAISKDNQDLYNKLVNWCKSSLEPLPKWITVFSFLLPSTLFCCLLAYFLTNNTSLISLAGYGFIINLGFMSVCFKRIKHEIADTTEIHEIIYNYSLIIDKIENENFESSKLKQLQQKLILEGQSAGKQIRVLSDLLSRMDTVNNLFVMILFNGAFLFHIHTLKALLNWKRQHAEDVKNWLDIIGETEALSSFANLYYNNPDFTFPTLNSKYNISFRDVAHPLLNSQTRVGNDVDFNPQFTILTGSNMSGKSTFLRCLGVNMVLAGIGAPVCAKKADIHPLPVLVSMRLSDSLSDSESYFFAEIKRLKQIMDSLYNKRAFVLLDEILRGTNSDDKRTGTVEVIKKMVAAKAIGAIATHDVEVCNTVSEYPENLRNSCFEAQIVSNNLFFDYKLRDGICKNKSATFLMEKIGVI